MIEQVYLSKSDSRVPSSEGGDSFISKFLNTTV